MVSGSRMGLPLPSFGFGLFSQLSQCLGPAGLREALAVLSLAFHLGAGLAGALAAFLVCRGSSCRLGIPEEVFFFDPSAFVLAVAGFGLIGCESWLRKRWRATMTLHLMYTGLGTWSLGVLLLIVSDWTFSRGVDI
ncbi:hypothetical protein BDE02_09G073800 [Populus trichocarpa]|nr:hypothetical protein BDE02_09G073800 [Populus trichocarpa]